MEILEKGFHKLLVFVVYVVCPLLDQRLHKHI